MEVPNYEMFTEEGNKAVHDMLSGVNGAILRGVRALGAAVPNQAAGRAAAEYLNQEMSVLARIGHGEVYDTAVREAIAAELTRRNGEWLWEAMEPYRGF